MQILLPGRGMRRPSGITTASKEAEGKRKGKWSGREDLNLRPPGPEPGALPG